MPVSLIAYRGPSRYDPASTIRVVLVPRSLNEKTGDMVQLFVLHDAVPPHVAQKTGADRAVCGECPLRPANDGGCYVTTFQGPLSTWKSTTGRPVASREEVERMLSGRALRLGAYGDVAALPPDLVECLALAAGGRVTGYTHGHRALGLAAVSHLRTWCMLSVESEADAAAAHAAGWRTFRPRAPDAPNMAGEITCPNETRGVQCVTCLLCRGASLPARSISIPVHGYAERKALRVVS